MRHEHVKSRLSEIINRLQNTSNGTTFSASQTDLTAKILYSTTANHSNHLKRPNFQKKTNNSAPTASTFPQNAVNNSRGLT